MTLKVNHPFVSPKPQGNDTTRIYGPQWNADHTITGTADATQLNANVVQAVTNDTNVTGAISAQTLTLGWTGTLAAARLNANVVQGVTNETNITGSISAQNLTFAWSGKLGLARGGTNADLSATGGTSQVLKQTTIGAAVTVGQLAFPDISGSVAATQMPALTGDITTSAGTVATTLATVNANVGTFGSATQASQITVNGKGLVTAAANVTVTPAVGSITGLGTGVATFLATPSSANLRAALTDEVGAGAAYFVGGALGTPASATLTNATGLPLTGLTTQAANTLVANATGAAAVPTAVDISTLTLKATPAATDIVLISDQAASGALKKVTVSSLATSSGVSSIAGNTGAFTLSHGLTNSTNDLRIDVAALQGHLFGLTLSAAGGTGTFGIAVGAAVDSTAADFMKLTSAYTKTTSAWAVGSGNGGIISGSLAGSTWYNVWLIKRPDTGVVDVVADTVADGSTNISTLASGAYTIFRRIGSMKTDGSNFWTKFSQLGDEFLWDVPVGDVLATNPGTAAVTRTLTVPTGVKVMAKVALVGSTSGTNTDSRFYASSLDVSDQASGTSTANAGSLNVSGTCADITTTFIRTNTSAQIRTRNQASDASTTIIINTYGWIDDRGKLS